jgi:hypothetical protein
VKDGITAFLSATGRPLSKAERSLYNQGEERLQIGKDAYIDQDANIDADVRRLSGKARERGTGPAF